MIAASFVLFLEFGLGMHFVTESLPQLTLHNNLFYYGGFYLRTYWPFFLLSAYGVTIGEPGARNKIILLSIPFVLYLITFSTLTDVIHYRYLFHITPLYYVIGAAASIDILSKIKDIRWKLVTSLTIIILFFLSGQGVIFPRNFYALEADDPTQLVRSYYAYTPQPDFNDAYAKVRADKQENEIIISTHPHFNKIFLNEPGYWLAYSYLTEEGSAKPIHEKEEYRIILKEK
jgi:hypothetical protein